MEERISAFAQLGRIMGTLSRESGWPGFSSGLAEDEYESFKRLVEDHVHSNGWFTADNIRKALLSWSEALAEANIRLWLSAYPALGIEREKRNVGIICAGNIPAVGLHDVISVLITGHRTLIKLSSSDDKLIPALLQLLVKLEPSFSDQFEIVTGKLYGHEAVIATGSNNTSRYFRYYFKDVPNIIRKSRTSVAVLDGTESVDEMTLLGKDIFDYFGLGCRNISKLYVPEGYDLSVFFNAIYPFHPIVNHNKYANNYDYNKAVWLLNMEDLLDNGFILLKQDKQVASPTASLYYEYYKERSVLESELEAMAEELQCVVGHGHIDFGEAQHPMLWEYADGVDTVDFLIALK